MPGLLGGSQEWVGVSLALLEKFCCGRRFLFVLLLTVPVIVNWPLGKWQLLAREVGQGRKVHLRFPSENLPVISHGPLWRWGSRVTS